LQAVNFFFRYEQKDDVLYRIGEVIGQDYTSTNNNNGTSYRWPSRGRPYATMQVGNRTPFNWVVLRLDAKQIITEQEDLSKAR
jgi:hypothetical protein